MVNPLNHYSLNNPSSVYDEEALTAIELAGRTASKVNESIKAYNELEGETKEAIDFMKSNIAKCTRETVTDMVKKGEITVGLTYEQPKEELVLTAIESAIQNGSRYYPEKEFLDIL